MLTYGIMVAGFALMLALLLNSRRHATPGEFVRCGVLLGTVWFSICLAVLG